MNETLFLLKSAQAKQFFQQNITILAQPEGSLITTRYKERWVHHGYQQQLPKHVVIAYAEPPFRHALPVREARLDKYEVDEEDESVLYYLTLGPLFTPTRLNESDAFLRKHRPRDALVFTVPSPLLPSTSIISPSTRWLSLVEYLVSPAYTRGHNPYVNAIFSFAHPLSKEMGQPVDSQMPLWVGHTYHQKVSLFAPGLTKESLSHVKVQLDYPRLTALLTSSGQIEQGEVTLIIQPQRRLSSSWTVTLFWRSPPPNIPSGPVHLTMPPIVRLPTLAARTPIGGEPFQRIQLFEWLSKKLSNRDQLRLLDRYLLPQADDSPPDPHLLLARAILLKKEGEMVEAVETLMQIPTNLRNDEMIVVLLESAVAAERLLPFTHLLDQLTDWDDGQRVQRIVLAITKLSEAIMLTLGYHLCCLAPNYAHLIWLEIGQTTQQSHHKLELIQFLQKSQPTQPNGYLRLSPNEVYHYLSRDAEVERLSDKHLNYLIDVGLHCSTPTGIATFFIEWMTRRLRQGTPKEIEHVKEYFQEAKRWISTSQQEKGVKMIMEALKRTGIAEMAEQALWLAIGRVEDARRSGDFDRAEEWLREARNSVGAILPENRSAMLNLIKDEDEEIKQFRDSLAVSFAPRYGRDPGLAPILKLYGITCVDAFWADLTDVMRENEFVARQLIERLDQLQQFAQQTGSTNANIHSLTILQGNVSRMELSDTSRLVFKKMGRTICLIALYANHDAYDGAIKQRWELMNRIQRG